MRTYSITSIFLLLFISLNTLIAQDSIPENSVKGISLKIDLKPNSAYRFLAKNSRNISQEMMGSTMEINQETTISYRFEVESNTSEGIKIKAFFEEIELDLDLPQGRTNIDSKNGNSSEFSRLLNKPFYITLTAQGKVIETEGLEEVFRSYEDNSDVLVQELFTEKNLIAFIESSFNIFPMDSINMGDSWNAVHNQSLNNQFDLTFDKTFTLDGLSEDMVWLSVENKVKSSASETLAFEVDSGDAKQEGIIEIDRNSGLILFSDIKQEIRGVLKSNGLEVPLRISLETSLKGEKL